MRTVVHITYLLGWIAYLIIFISKKNGILLPHFIQCYFADLLSIPLVLGIINYLLKNYTSKKGFKLSLAMIFAACLYFSVFFEWILPSYSSAYTQDIWDVFCYFAGGGLFYLTTHFTFNQPFEHATTVR